MSKGWLAAWLALLLAAPSWAQLAVPEAVQRTAAARVLLVPAMLRTATSEQRASARRALLERADAALALKPPSVLDKTLTAASGDRHDYLSFGPYWWPDPAKPDGLPYVRRDGQRNPEAARGSDALALARLGAAIETLGLAYEETKDERYATKAAQLARTWFLDVATRMNPHFEHAQAIPGITPGRGIGLIEARWLIAVNEGLARTAAAQAWKAGEPEALRRWMHDFYRWLRSSAHGRAEEGEHNNHGSWYDAQAAHLALVLGRDDEARDLLRQGLQRRVAAHIEPDGRQPHELARTRPLDYSLFNLEALVICAQLADLVGLDWWSYASPDGRSLRAALAFLAPYAADPAKPWPYAELVPADRRRLLPLLAAYLHRRGDDALRAAYAAAEALAEPASMWRLLPSPPPR